MSPFQRVVRFEAADGNVYYGEAPDIVPDHGLSGKELPVYESSPFDAPAKLSGTKTVSKVLCPIPMTGHIYGVGLNYKAHAEEANLPLPEYPMIFSKPVDALAGPYETIQVDKQCTLMDYEVRILKFDNIDSTNDRQGELAVVIGKDCKNIPEEDDPLDYVLGFCAGNDFSSRYWQMPERAGQAGYAKGFDKFAPIGPILVSPELLPDIGSLKMTTKVNGEERQSTLLNDLIFDVSTLVRHLSRGMTLRKFTVILTGTPSGVGALMKPPAWLQDGDVVTVEIDGIGKISSRLQFLS